MALAYRRNPHEPQSVFVARITLCKGVPFYGFHVGWRFYLKIYMLNPAHMTRLADLLRQGAVMGQIFQPYEAHIQFILQFMIDFNLYGCGFIECEKVLFRAPVPSVGDVGAEQLWHDQSIPNRLISTSDEFPRLSYCSIEIDVQVQDIMNRRAVTPRLLHHDFIERRSPLPTGMKFVQSMAELWKDENRRRGINGQSLDYVAPLSADWRSTNGGWIHEEEYKEKIAELIDDERRKLSRPVHFNNYVKRTPFEGLVQTVLDSVMDMFPNNQSASWMEGRTTPNQQAEDVIGAEVNENKIAEYDESDDDSTTEEEDDSFKANETDLDEKGRTAVRGNGDKPRDLETAAQNLLYSSGIRSIHDDETDDFDIPLEFFSNTVPKRSAPVTLLETPNKRQRTSMTPQPASANPTEKARVWQFTSATPRVKSSLSQFSTPSLDGNSQLPFPAVKNPGPETALRLSQESLSGSPSHKISSYVEEGALSSQATLPASFELSSLEEDVSFSPLFGG